LAETIDKHDLALRKIDQPRLRLTETSIAFYALGDTSLIRGGHMDLPHPTLDPGREYRGLVQFASGATATGRAAHTSSPPERAPQQRTLLRQDGLQDLLLRLLGLGQGLPQATGLLTHAPTIASAGDYVNT
jgi:hypothetical protein